MNKKYFFYGLSFLALTAAGISCKSNTTAQNKGKENTNSQDATRAAMEAELKAKIAQGEAEKARNEAERARNEAINARGITKSEEMPSPEPEIFGYRAAPDAVKKYPDALKDSKAVEQNRMDGPILPPTTDSTSNNEEYDKIVENPFIETQKENFSTFSIDVDNASYSNIRRMLSSGQLPPADAVRIEEMINYFNYNYPQPTGKDPFSITTEISAAPWNPDNQLVHIGLQGKELDYTNLKSSNLVFLLDVSGSMSDANKLPLLKESLKLLLNELDDRDRISIVVYAGAAGLVLPATPASDKDKIIAALDQLQAGGSTAGGAGIQLAYKVAQENFIKDGNNRIILATDGDFNVGIYDTDELVKYIEEKRKTGVYLTICGFGMGNYKDNRLELISNKGNGNYFYIDNMDEAKKVFQREMRANMFTLSKDVKIQIEFDPQYVKSYRLIGYENRRLNKEDFDDDTKDAGELGAGHSVTALYEVVPANAAKPAGDWMKVNFRYKPLDSDQSILIEKSLSVKQLDKTCEKASDNFRLSAAVAGWGMLLRNSAYKGSLTYTQIIDLAKNAAGANPDEECQELLKMMERAKQLSAGK